MKNKIICATLVALGSFAYGSVPAASSSQELVVLVAQPAPSQRSDDAMQRERDAKKAELLRKVSLIGQDGGYSVTSSVLPYVKVVRFYPMRRDPVTGDIILSKCEDGHKMHCGPEYAERPDYFTRTSVFANLDYVNPCDISDAIDHNPSLCLYDRIAVAQLVHGIKSGKVRMVKDSPHVKIEFFGDDGKVHIVGNIK